MRSSESTPPKHPHPGQGRKLWMALAAVGIAVGAGAWFMSRTGRGPAVPDVSATQAAAPAMPAQRDPFTIAAELEGIVRHADPAVSVNTLTHQAQLVIGRDELQLEVSASTTGYLYVYMTSTDQQHLYLLLPNTVDTHNRIEAKQVLRLPRQSWPIRANGPAGVAHILTVVSPTPRPVSTLGLRANNIIPEVDMQQAAKAWRSQAYGASLIHIEEMTN